MKLIAWDTSSKTGALVALEWDANQDIHLVTELTLNVDLTHSERLLWGIHQVLESARWSLKEVDYFGVGVGPGSFTGLRIGVTTARTLAHTLKKPLVKVSSLAALLKPIEFLKSQSLVVACTDACKGELFARWEFLGQVQERVIRPEPLMDELLRVLSQMGKQSTWIAVGEGRRRHPDAWKSLPLERERTSVSLFSDQVQGRYVGQLAIEAIRAGKIYEGLQVHPEYLRASDAELKLKAGLLMKNGPSRIVS